MSRNLIVTGCAFWMCLFAATSTSYGDWTRFRGPNGSGLSPDTKPVPVVWSPGENLKWKTVLPGPGVSSPIIVGDRLYSCVTPPSTRSLASHVASRHSYIREWATVLGR